MIISKSIRKRGLALFLAFMMCLSTLPATALAANTAETCGCGSPVMYEAYSDCHYALCAAAKCPYSVKSSHSYTDGACICGAAAPGSTADTGDSSKPCKHEYKDGICGWCGEPDPNAPAVHVCQKFDESDHCTECRALNPKHKHVWDNNKCICGEQHEHVWQYKTYSGHPDRFWHTKYCSCGMTDEEECETKKVFEEGLNKTKCILCGYWEPVEEKNPHVHDYVYTWTGTKHTGICKGEDDLSCTAKTIISDCVFDRKGSDPDRDYCICGNSKSNVVEIGPGGGSECPDGQHEYYGTAVSNQAGAHTLTCIKCGHNETEGCKYELYYANGNTVTAQYCPVCHFTLETVPTDVCTNATEGHRFAETGKVVSDDGRVVFTLFKCSNCGITIQDVCETSPTVTVDYVYEDGSTASPSVTRATIKGQAYSITSPGIKGYTPDQEVVEGVGTGEDHTVKVIYRADLVQPAEYTLTIQYEVEGGEELYGRYEAKLKAGELYEVTSPTDIEGYTPETGTVKGTMPDGDTNITVKYSLTSYTWTIRYVDEENKAIPGSTPEIIAFNLETIKTLKAHHVPLFDGYTTSTVIVEPPSGKLGNKEDVVVYRKDPVKPVETPFTVTFVDGYDNRIIETLNNVTALPEQGAYPAAPGHNGYRFDYWSAPVKDEDGNYTITARYVRQITVTWIDADGQLIKRITIDVNSGYSSQYPANRDQDGHWGSPVTDANGNITIQWVLGHPATRTVTWLSGFGTNRVLHNDEIPWDTTDVPARLYPRDPYRSGYTFRSWGTPVIGEDGNITITARWRAIPDGDDDDDRPTGGSTGGGTTTIPDTQTPLDPGTTIIDQEVPLAGAVGLNDADHFAYVIGYEDGTVRPLNNISRAEVATIFFRLMTDDYRQANWSTVNSFSDVKEGDWYNNAISTCARAGALKGRGDGSVFDPNANITRAEFAVIAARFLDSSYVDDGKGDFADTADHWAAKEIRLAAKAGWVNGNGNTFNPDAYITRAEVMTIVNRMLDRTPDKDHMLPDMKKWTDNPEDAWYYEAVQEATNEHDYTRDETAVESWTLVKEHRDWAALELGWAANGGAAAPQGETETQGLPDGI